MPWKDSKANFDVLMPVSKSFSHLSYSNKLSFLIDHTPCI